ncbi:hypothetical protein KKI24_25665 [bacterium]|nr:hypothetical protein [bacterium]
MNMKKQIFEYMNHHPEATIEELITLFPSAKKKSLWNYSRQWKKDQGTPSVGKRNSIRQRIFTFIDQHPDATQKDLQQAFPDVNKVSISNYHYQWRKARPDLKKKNSVKDVVFTYLDCNPQATYRELKNALPGINPSSISAYHSIWKQSQSGGVKRTTAIEGPPSRKKNQFPGNYQDGQAPELSIESVVTSKSARNLVEILISTIETQNAAIEIIKEQNAILRQHQSDILIDLEEISGDEWQTLRDIIAIFIRGLKSNG